ncbi:MAG TPA: hypothetical protein VHG52_01145 [Thermomicrobiales bacterium]|nr:hypothetical protein [Thermomicrobiales bacterium]
MILEVIRHAFGAVSPPHPRKTLERPPPMTSGFVLTLASSSTPSGALERLLQSIELPAGARTLVVPSVAVRQGTGAHPALVASLLDVLGARAVLGIPAGTAQPIRRRWTNLAAGRGVSCLTLGTLGWDRVELSGDAYMLDEVLLPAELADADARIFIPAIGDEPLALGFTRRIVHPHTRLRARGNANRDRLDAEIASTVTARYLLDASRLRGDIPASACFWTADALTAELAGVGLRRLMDSLGGIESVSAWEHERIQAATELGQGPAAGKDIVLRAERDGEASQQIAESLRDELGCRIEWLEREGAH